MCVRFVLGVRCCCVVLCCVVLCAVKREVMLEFSAVLNAKMCLHKISKESLHIFLFLPHAQGENGRA
jgi:hypothetical protein